MNIELKKLLNKTKLIIYKAGEETLKIYKSNIKYEIKEDNSPVTEADRVSDEIILSGLKQFNYPVLSEESVDDSDRLSSKRVWIVDSLDGTTDFIQKTGEFSIMVGLVEDNKPILGFVYLPLKDKLYYAPKGQGSFLESNGIIKRIKVSNINNFSKSRLVVSRNHLKPEDKKKANEMGILRLKKSGSNGIKMGLIAEAEADIFYNTTNRMSQWDSCAPEIILTEAGGKVTDIEGNEILYNTEKIKLERGLVASNGIIHNKIITNINK